MVFVKRNMQERRTMKKRVFQMFLSIGVIISIIISSFVAYIEAAEQDCYSIVDDTNNLCSMKVDEIYSSENGICFILIPLNSSIYITESTCILNEVELNLCGIEEINNDVFVLNFYSDDVALFNNDFFDIKLSCIYEDNVSEQFKVFVNRPDITEGIVHLEEKIKFDDGVTLELGDALVREGVIFIYGKGLLPPTDISYYLNGRDDKGNCVSFHLSYADEHFVLFTSEMENDINDDMECMSLRFYVRKIISEELISAQQVNEVYAEETVLNTFEEYPVGEEIKIKIN